MNDRLSMTELLGILGPVEEEKKKEVAGFCISHSSHEDFETAWQKSRELRERDPYYYEEITEID